MRRQESSLSVRRWFTSDTHLGHSNIIMYSNREQFQIPGVPYKNKYRTYESHPDIDLHDDTIISNINDAVSKDDILYHLGDFSFKGKTRIKEYRQRISCDNIILIIGNHDQYRIKPKDDIKKIQNNYKDIFSDIQFYSEVEIGSYPFFLTHIPVYDDESIPDPMMYKNPANIHGHIHTINNPLFYQKGSIACLDVGVDNFRFKPVSENEILRLYENHLNTNYEQI